MMLHRIGILSLVVVATGLVGCASGPDNSKGRYKVGKPYNIGGKTYYPEENYTYEQTGVASWYGPGFHGKQTANGERFDEGALTAAHPTLQMPSLVRVTNLSNDASVILRVNDRGPFHGGRVIDVSKAAADALGFRMQGTAKVRVQVLGPESQVLAEAAKRGVDTRGAEIAMNNTGTLDERFAPFSPTFAREPQAPVMVADASYVPQVPASDSLVVPTLAVPGSPVPLPPTMDVAAAPLPPQSPLVGQVAQMAPVLEAPVSAPAPRVVQMAPVYEGPVPPASSVFPSVPVAQLQPQDVVPVAVGGRYYVQAGSFMSQANAQRLREQVGHLGPSQVVSTNVGDQPWFRVRIGPLESVEKADQLVNTLQRQGRQASIVVANN